MSNNPTKNRRRSSIKGAKMGALAIVGAAIIGVLGSLLVPRVDKFLDSRDRPKLEEANNHYERGGEYARQGKIDEAIGEYEEAIKINPDFAEAYNALGVIYWKDRHLLYQAERAFEEALRINPNYISPRFGLAGMYITNELTEEAETHLREVLKRTSKKEERAQAYLALGEIYYYYKKLPNKAREYIVEGLQLDPEGTRSSPLFREAYSELSEMSKKTLEKIDEREEDNDKPEHPKGVLSQDLKARIGNAKKLFESSRFREATLRFDTLVPELEEITRINPSNAEAHLELSGAYLFKFWAASKLPPGNLRTKAMTDAVRGRYPERIREEMEKFKFYADPNDPRLEALDRLLQELPLPKK